MTPKREHQTFRLQIAQDGSAEVKDSNNRILHAIAGSATIPMQEFWQDLRRFANNHAPCSWINNHGEAIKLGH